MHYYIYSTNTYRSLGLFFLPSPYLETFFINYLNLTVGPPFQVREEAFHQSIQKYLCDQSRYVTKNRLLRSALRPRCSARPNC